MTAIVGTKRGWALVTGASSGLGAVFARRLAARGHDVILTARRRDRLEALAAEIRAQYNVDALVLEADLAMSGAAPALVRELDARGVEPTVLVNNAGFGAHGHAVHVPVERATAMIQVNVTALTELAVLLGAKMAARGGGAIVNVASTAAFQPTPYFAVYAATKAYVTSFSQALAYELAPRGVRVLALCPGPTKTEFFDASDVQRDIPELVTMSAEACVDVALRALDRRRRLVVAGVLNALVGWISRVSPMWLSTRVTGMLMRPTRARPVLPSPK